MVTTRLDPIDRKILSELQDDGRMTHVELARRVGLSAPPCLRRVRTARRRTTERAHRRWMRGVEFVLSRRCAEISVNV